MIHEGIAADGTDPSGVTLGPADALAAALHVGKGRSDEPVERKRRPADRRGKLDEEIAVHETIGPDVDEAFVTRPLVPGPSDEGLVNARSIVERDRKECDDFTEHVERHGR